MALTGWGSLEDRQKAEAAGFDVHLVKPVEPERLRDIVFNSWTVAAAWSRHGPVTFILHPILQMPLDPLAILGPDSLIAYRVASMRAGERR